MALILAAVSLVVSAAFVASGMWYGANQCVVREELKRNPRQKMWKGLAWCGAFDVPLLIVSLILAHSHGDFMAASMVAAAAAQFGIGATLISAGCM